MEEASADESFPYEPSLQYAKNFMPALEVEKLVKQTSTASVSTPPPFLYAIFGTLAAYIAETATRCWVALGFAILLEIWATTLTKVASDSQSATTLFQGLALYIISLLGFAAALPKIEVGIAYAVWAALGTALVSVVGIVYFGERCDAKKVISLTLIVAGTVGLNVFDDSEH
jgi:small multidrug resistance pump